ncbi:hypothetical protein HAZT_HAZT002281 [Hyalella azteca]|uniref:Uncharacterized protein n=1 Tax=Hyalella azteca TaxID=294128 RepID=A0A6A0H5C4_HYAAZ|nr:hypothetical protein HAZT_HAZT002281 [Hyalella azteca]
MSVRSSKNTSKSRIIVTRESKAQTERESVFKEELERVFDAAHKDVPSIMKIEEDIVFLVVQRQPGRPGYMGGIDAELARKEERN